MADSKPSRDEKLAAYRKKRSAGATPEPPGGRAHRPGLFVVQKHSARALHYDLRIEVGGVLVSWALPKGPSLDPAEKRMAIATEDHPIEYGDFEGVIPEGNYGAGAMILWDRGLCVPHLDHAEGLETGKLLFELRGYKLRGLWTLVRTKRGEGKQWLLIKKPDAHAASEDASELAPGSILSGLTVEELRSGRDKAHEICRELESAGAPRAEVDPNTLPLMLAERAPAPFSRAGWIFEIKYDGFRMLACKSLKTKTEHSGGTSPGHSGGTCLLSRNRMDLTAAFPEIARALAALPYRALVLDGEITVPGEDARPSFSRLQKRARKLRRPDVERAAIETPAVFFAFDLLAFEGFDPRPRPLLERKALLRRLLPAAGPIRFADHIEERGEDFHRGVRELGLEGAMAKRADSPYRGGRSPDWLKLRAEHRGDFVLAGLGRGARTGLRSLHLAVLAGTRLVYAGSVASGLSRALAKEIEEKAAGLHQSDPPCEGAPARAGGAQWLRPELVVEVRYLEYTASGHLRHPVLLGLRPDKEPGECFREDLPPDPSELASREPARPAPPEEPPLTRLTKVFWPESGHTKGDLIDYYRAISPWLLPYLRDRPLVLDRYPDGIEGKSFFQKHAPDYAPEWLRTEAVWSRKEEAEEEQDDGEDRFFVCDDLPSLLYLINLGSIPLHVWSSRCASPQHPDWAILDLDAKDAPFSHVVTVARAIHRLCREIELPAYPKTSGATGLHVLIPLGGGPTHQQARQLAELLATLIAQELPEVASVARSPAARRGQVYVDFLQNGYGKLLVAPFSARPRPGAPVSMPLRWREVGPRLDPARFTIESAPRRLRRLGEDPLAPVLAERPDLPAALARLAKRLEDRPTA